MESKVCSRSQGQPPGARRRSMMATARSKRSPVVDIPATNVNEFEGRGQYRTGILACERDAPATAAGTAALQRQPLNLEGILGLRNDPPLFRKRGGAAIVEQPFPFTRLGP